MKMKRNKNNKQDPSIIGGTIAVPDNTIDISCRSDLTLDLDLHESPRPRRKKLDIMLAPLPSRDADESTHYSPPLNGTTRRDYYDDEDGITNNDTDIDKIAEQAAYSCFGADADQKLDADGEGRPIRRSTLVAENSAIDGAYYFVFVIVCMLYVLQLYLCIYHLIHSFLHFKITFYIYL